MKSRTHQIQIQQQILNRFTEEDSVFFVQVGSNDGVQGDPLHDLITANKKWKGIFIEPVKTPFNRLKHNYGNSSRFIFVNKAVASNVGVKEFFFVAETAKLELGDTLPYWYDQLGSFDKNHILKHLNGIPELCISSELVQTIPLQDLLEKYKVSEIDVLHIDAEGYDYKVLLTLDFSIYRPLVVLYEHTHLSRVERKSAVSLLRKNGYCCIPYGTDTLAFITHWQILAAPP